MGEGALPVVMEAGVGATSISWRRMQEEVALFTRAVTYDRRGLGWSDAPATPRLIPNLLAELEAGLRDIAVEGPIVLVGHSFGGYLARHFAAAWPGRVAALVLVDPLEPEEFWPVGAHERYQLSRGALLSRWGAKLAWIGVVRFAVESMLSGSRFLPKMIATAASTGRGASFIERLVGELRKLPVETWGAMKSHWCLPKNFIALADYLDALPRNCSTPPDGAALKDIPLWLISAGEVPDKRRPGHLRTAALSARSQHWTAENSGHWVHLDAPDLVLRAIREAWLSYHV
jgi:pimeloyl-ACP methyl ester carboxylesterase